MKQALRGHWSRANKTIFVLLALLGISLGAFGQAPILSFSFDESSLSIPAGQSAMHRLRVRNDSVYAADDVEIILLSGPAELLPLEPIQVVNAFSDDSLNLQIQAAEDAVIVGDELRFEVSYTYCIGELCFQIVEPLTLAVEITAAPIQPVSDTTIEPILDPATDSIPIHEPGSTAEANPLFPLLFPIALVVVLCAALIASKVIGRRWWILGLFLAVLAGGMGYGILLRQDQQAQSIGAVLCTSCVGIEETPHNDPDLSSAGEARVKGLSMAIELRVFSATWCHACPYAKELVRQVVQANALITSQVIDVDEDREAADRYGIIQSGRTIVPAILRVDTGEVLFGIEDLEERLIALLEETP